MATVAYASIVDLDDFLPVDESPSDVERLLQRASELLDDKVRTPFAVDTVTKLPTDTDVAEALKQACCAQVEYWVRGPGEEHDIEGLANRQVSIGHLNMAALPPELGPRAVRFLRSAGLLQIGHSTPVGCW